MVFSALLVLVTADKVMLKEEIAKLTGRLPVEIPKEMEARIELAILREVAKGKGLEEAKVMVLATPTPEIVALTGFVPSPLTKFTGLYPITGLNPITGFYPYVF